jgi:hypothetical protein
MKSLKVKFDFIKLFLFEIEFVSGNDKGESKDEIEDSKPIAADKQP